MTIGRTRASILVATLAIFVSSAPPAHAALAKIQLKCSKAIAKGGLGFVKGKVKLLQKCRNADFKDGSCAAPDPAAITKLEDKLLGTIDKACNIFIGNFPALGFPGPCTDANPGDLFTLADIKDCMLSSHETIVDQMMALQYDTTLVGLLGSADLKCQAEVAKQSGALTACVLKNVQKCRDDLNKGKALGVPPDFCATDYAKASAAIQKCEDKLTAGIAAKCTTPQVVSLKLCEPDQADAADAASCLIAAHTVRIDGTEIIVPPDLIDYEYAVRGGLCGDGIINNINEECDAPDDGACIGQCGEALVGPTDGHFACLCKTKPRMVIVEHTNADTDNGWTLQSNDGAVVEGGNYLVDLYDCDGGGLCNAGPSCSLPPHSPCAVASTAPSGTTSDSICIGMGQGLCRKERTAAGPHCSVNIQKKCDFRNPGDTVCNDTPADFCTTTFHGPPVAAAAGGVAVCNVSTFTEDIVGTANIMDGTAAVKIRQNALTYQNLVGPQDKPCPVCGGFCGVDRMRCDVDADCAPGMGPCVTEAVCSDGPKIDKVCRRTAPFGGPVGLFGVTSVDCPPVTATAQGLGLDVNVNPRTTGTVTLLPTFACSAAGLKECTGGPNDDRSCTVASECPGGTCDPAIRCSCAGQERPNACSAACLGGGSDAEPCVVDSDCLGGFCHAADCRLDLLDLDSNQEGICASGPADGKCSFTSFRACTIDSNCAPPSCPFCVGGETCIFTNRACFVDGGITRIGTPRTPNGESAGVYCVPATGTGAVDSVAGFPGPGALIQRETMLVVP